MAAKVSGKFIKSEDPNLYRQKMERMASCDVTIVTENITPAVSKRQW